MQTHICTGALAGPAVLPAAAATTAHLTHLQQPVFSHGNRARERKWQLSAIHMADEPERDCM